MTDAEKEKRRERLKLHNPMHLITPERKEQWRKKLSISCMGRIPWDPKGSKRPEMCGENHPRWKGGRGITGGYIVLTLPNGHKIKEHHLVMEKHLGRHLKASEVIHHINGRRDDNRIDNLELMDFREHIKKYHSINPSSTSAERK